MEPIIIFQKSWEGESIQPILGTGLYNFDGARLPVFDEIDRLGRTPPNFVLIHHPECVFVGMMDAPRNGNISPTDRAMKSPRNTGNTFSLDLRSHNSWIGYGEGNSEKVPHWECVEECPVRLLNEQTDKIPSRYFKTAHWESGERLWEYPSTVKYASKPKEGRWHPTQKPVDLTTWLATLLLPPPEFVPRKLFVPFAGVGSEMLGAVRAGWEIVTGIEQDEKYVLKAGERLSKELVGKD